MQDSPQSIASPSIRERFPDLYEELRDVAASLFGPTTPPSVAPTDLAHEAFLRLHAEELRRRTKGRSELGAKPARVFGGLTVAECAKLLGVSPRTANRKWKFARAWLEERLQ